MKLDLKTAKKIASDDKTSTFALPGGHQIKVAHSSLSPENQKAIKALPHFDGGGSVAGSPNVDPAKAKQFSDSFNNSGGWQPQKWAQNISNAFSSDDTQKKAYGGAIKQSNPKLEESKKVPHYDAGGYVSTNPSVTSPTSDTNKPQPEEPVEATDDDSKKLKLAYGGDDTPNPQPNDSSDRPQPPVVINVGGGGVQQAPQQTIPVPATPNASTPQGPVATTGNNPGNPTPPAPPGQEPLQVEPMDNNSPAAAPAPKRAPIIHDLGGSTVNTSDVGGPDQGNTPQQASSLPQTPSVPTPPFVALPGFEGKSIEYQQTYQQFQQEHAAQYAQQDAAYAQDLANGHITPETYKSLFAKKDTLGKVGSIFGMLLGSMGSGLTGQENTYVTAMNNIIKNDFEAQKQSKANAQNLIRLNYQHQLQQAEANGLDVTAAHVKQQAYQEATTFGYMQQNRNVLQDLTDQANNLPPTSPDGQNARKILPYLNSAVQNENYGIASRAAALKAWMNMSPGAESSTPKSSPINSAKVNELTRKNQLKMPGAPTDADLASINSESKQVLDNEANRASFNNSFDEVDKMVAAGKFSPNQRKAYVTETANRIAKTNNLSTEEAKAQAEAMFPEGNDMGADTRKIKRAQGNRYFDNGSAATPTLNRFNLKNQVNNQPSTPPPSNAPEGSTGMFNGKPVIKVNGQWKFK